MRRLLALLLLLAVPCAWADPDGFAPGYDLIRDDGTDENRRGALNLIGASVSCADDSANNETECTISASGATPGGSDTQLQYNDGGSALGGIAGVIWDDTNLEIADDQDVAFGTDADWLLQYDEGVDDQLLFRTAKTATAATTDPMFEILADTGAAGMTANQQVFGLGIGSQASNTAIFTVDEDGDVVAAGTAEATGGFTINTTTETNIEAVVDLPGLQGQIGDAQIADAAVDGGSGGEITDASVTADDLGTDSVSADELNATGVESELESALDIGGEVSSTGMASTVVADSLTVASWTLDSATATTLFVIPQGTGPTADDVGEIAHDTSDNQLILDDGVYPKKFDHSFTIIAPYASFDDIPIFSKSDGFTVTNIRCWAAGGTSVGITLTDNTNDLDTITCDLDGADDDGSIANATFTASEQMFVDTGTVTGAVTSVNVRFTYTVTRE